VSEHAGSGKASAIPHLISRWEPFLVEWLLVANSLWLGISLLDADFARVAASTAQIVQAVGLTPPIASLLAFSAAGFKIAGLFVCLMDGGSTGGMWLRMLGLSIGVFIWCTLGIGFMTNAEWLPTAFGSFSWGVTSLVVLIRTPALPGGRSR
jgi:hypothetical protein